MVQFSAIHKVARSAKSIYSHHGAMHGAYYYCVHFARMSMFASYGSIFQNPSVFAYCFWTTTRHLK